MQQMSAEQDQPVLAELESFRIENGLSKRDLSQSIGIPHETLRKWFRAGPTATRPSKDHLAKIQAFVAANRRPWEEIWPEIVRWWQTQHRYSDVRQLAEEIGWSADDLRACIDGAVKPARLVLERLAEVAQVGVAPRILSAEELTRKIERLRALLTILAEELAWFRDGPQQGRQVYRSEMDPFDTGYVASLLTMLFAEDKFRRWLEITTNRFNYFKGKGTQR
jgi:transcriptional regulator with XRE-family HTH domain